MRWAQASSAVALVAAVGWACTDYDDAFPEPSPDSGAPNGVVASLTVSNLTVARDERATATVNVVRGERAGALDVAFSSLPRGVTASKVTIAPGTTTGSVEMAAAYDADEGATTVELSLLDGNTKIATASAVLTVGPLRSGAIDSSFGTGGSLELGALTSPVFSPNGTLYGVDEGNIVRFGADGTRDSGYGPNPSARKHNLTLFLPNDDGRVFFTSTEPPPTGGAVVFNVPFVYRTSADGKSFDRSWGASTGGPDPSVRTGEARLLPVDRYGTVRAFGVARDGKADYRGLVTGEDGGPSALVVDLGASGERGVSTPLPVNAPGAAFIGDAILVSDGYAADARVRVFGGTALAELFALPGSAETVAWDGASAFLARTQKDAPATIARLGTSGIDARFGGTAGVASEGAVRAMVVDDKGRVIAGSCSKPPARWIRYLQDGSVDPDFRVGSTDLPCVAALGLTPTHLLIAAADAGPAVTDVSAPPVPRVRLIRVLR